MTRIHTRRIITDADFTKLLAYGLAPGFLVLEHPVTGNYELISGRAARLLRGGKLRIAARELRKNSRRRS